MHDTILIVDFGSQVTQLIARRVREEGVYSEIVPFHAAADAFRKTRPKGVILAIPASTGGPSSKCSRIAGCSTASGVRASATPSG